MLLRVNDILKQLDAIQNISIHLDAIEYSFSPSCQQNPVFACLPSHLPHELGAHRRFRMSCPTEVLSPFAIFSIVSSRGRTLPASSLGT